MADDGSRCRRAPTQGPDRPFGALHLTTLRSASGLDGGQPTIVHTTLFRFGVDLRDPPALLKATQSMLLDACFRVREIVVTREVLYPSIITDDVARFPLHAVTT
jgi:hypothetical protein